MPVKNTDELTKLADYIGLLKRETRNATKDTPFTYIVTPVPVVNDAKGKISKTPMLIPGALTEGPFKSAKKFWKENGVSAVQTVEGVCGVQKGLIVLRPAEEGKNLKGIRKILAKAGVVGSYDLAGIEDDDGGENIIIIEQSEPIQNISNAPSPSIVIDPPIQPNPLPRPVPPPRRAPDPVPNIMPPQPKLQPSPGLQRRENAPRLAPTRVALTPEQLQERAERRDLFDQEFAGFTNALRQLPNEHPLRTQTEQRWKDMQGMARANFDAQVVKNLREDLTRGTIQLGAQITMNIRAVEVCGQFANVVPELKKEVNRGFLKGRVGKKFAPVLRGLEKMTGGQMINDMQMAEVARAASDYLANRGEEDAQLDDTTQRKIEICNNVLRMRKIIAISKSPMPWTLEIEGEMREAQAQLMLGAGGSARIPGERGESESFFLRDGENRLAFVFKPGAGQGEKDQSARGFEPGGAAPREVLMSVLGEELQAMSGINCGIARASWATLESNDLDPIRQRSGVIQEFLPSSGGMKQFFGDPMSLLPDINDPRYNVEMERAMNNRPQLLQQIRTNLERIQPEDMENLAILDFVTLNLDRNIGNLLVREEGQNLRLLPIDGGNNLPCRAAFERNGHTMFAPPIPGMQVIPDGLNVLCQLPGFDAMFNAQSVAKIKGMDANQLTGRLQQTFNNISEGNDQLQGAVDPSTFELTRLSTLFLQFACDKLTKAQIAEAYAVHFKRVIKAALDNDQQQNLQPVFEGIVEAMQMNAVFKRESQAPDLREQLIALGWNYVALTRDADYPLQAGIIKWQVSQADYEEAGGADHWEALIASGTLARIPESLNLLERMEAMRNFIG